MRRLATRIGKDGVLRVISQSPRASRRDNKIILATRGIPQTPIYDYILNDLR